LPTVGPPCTSVPTAPLTSGTWPASCSGVNTNYLCYANCTYGGNARLVCQTTGNWSAVLGSCNGGCPFVWGCLPALPASSMGGGAAKANAPCARQLAGASTLPKTCRMPHSAVLSLWLGTPSVDGCLLLLSLL
jgi:hypothetical protein